MSTTARDAPTNTDPARIAMSNALQHVEDSAATLAAMQLCNDQLRAERDALAARLHGIAEALASAGDCLTWAALAGLLAKVAQLAGGERQP